jgi:SpoVK/Ycf46/Vps4 family AAA+-type ATPase
MNDHTVSTVSPLQSPEILNAEEPAAGPGDFTRIRDNPFICAKTMGFVLNFLQQEKGTLEDDDFFEFIVHILGDHAAVDLARRCCSLEQLRGQTRMLLEASGNDTAPNILSDLWSNRHTHAELKKALLAELSRKRAQLDRAATEVREQDMLYRRFDEMTQLFGLVEYEADLLLLAYIRHAGLWNWTAIGRSRTGHGPFQRICLMAQILGLPRALVAGYFQETGRLRSLGCVDGDLDFKPELEPFLIGLSAEPLASKYFVRCTNAALPWAMHGKLSEQHGELLKALIRRRSSDRGLNMLFYGAAGTGKTSFACSLAAELGLDLYRIRVSEEFESNVGGARPRFAALRICDSQVNGNRSLILIDEADEMVSGTGGDLAELLSERPEREAGRKDTLNTILDQLKTPCIWITNSPPGRLAASARRRFDYSIEFKALSRQQRCQVWKNLRCQYRLREVLDDEMIDSLARRFAVSAGGVDLALRNYSRLREDGLAAPGSAMEALERLLVPHCQLMGIKPDGGTTMVDSAYSPAGLNVRGPVLPVQILTSLREFRRKSENSEAAGQIADHNARRLTLLLSGPPGTGKTEFVAYLGRELDCPVQTCMPGDLLSRYVGGTEQNIREAFRTAAEDHAILFLDEADGMLRSRQLADRGWEVTQVNELLYAMEHFRGILICATNSVQTLDPATIRRFIFKLEFDFLDGSGKLAFYQRMLADLAQKPLDEPGRRRLENITDLTPGDFHTVRQTMYYLDGGGQGITHDDLLAALEQESCAKRQGKGGFGFGR